MNNTPAWQGKFAEGFTSSGGATDWGTLLWLLVFLVVVGLAIYLWMLLTRSQTTTKRGSKTVSSRARFVAVPGKINPLQQVRIQEMIDEFRKQEPLAQAVPSAVLEKYSEYFFHQVGKLKTTDREVETFINQNYALKNGDPVELDFHTSGSVHLIKSKVSGIGQKSILVDYQSPIPEFLRPGMSIRVNYSSGRHFLQGSSQITEVRQDAGLLIRRPTQVILTSERRYSRLPMVKATGTLQDTKSDYHSPVKVLDLSLEGVRVQVGRPLDKSHIYLLSFDAEALGRVWPFGPLECVPSKAFMTGAGTYESGLVFLTMTLAVKQKMVTFMKALAQELQAEKEGSEPR